MPYRQLRKIKGDPKVLQLLCLTTISVVLHLASRAFPLFKTFKHYYQIINTIKHNLFEMIMKYTKSIVKQDTFFVPSKKLSFMDRNSSIIKDHRICVTLISPAYSILWISEQDPLSTLKYTYLLLLSSFTHQSFHGLH